MGWKCACCGITNGDHRRKCMDAECRHPGGPQAAWDALRTSSTAFSGPKRSWECQCGMVNSSRRANCGQCKLAPPAQTPSASSGRKPPAFTTPKANETPNKSSGILRTPSSARTPFLSAVLKEAEKYQHSDTDRAGNSMDVDAANLDAGTSREALQEELRKAEAAVVALEQVADDPDILKVLESRKAKRDHVREQLRAARPLRSQLRAAEEARDKACKRHAALSQEVLNLRLIVAGKEKELARADAEARDAMAKVTLLHEKVVKEALQSENSDSGNSRGHAMSLSPPINSVQWAAGFAHSLLRPARGSFEQWMTYASINPIDSKSWDGQANPLAGRTATTVFDVDDEDIDDAAAMEGPEPPAGEGLTVSAVLQAQTGSENYCSTRDQGATDSQGLRPFRQKNTRYDPYGGKKQEPPKGRSEKHETDDPEDGEAEISQTSASGDC